MAPVTMIVRYLLVLGLYIELHQSLTLPLPTSVFEYRQVSK